MPAGIGMDLIEISRMERFFERHENFARVFTAEELEYIASKGASFAQSAAGIFCAKEAAAKALADRSDGVTWTDICVHHDQKGAPHLTVKGVDYDFLVTITHCDCHAAATVISLNRDK